MNKGKPFENPFKIAKNTEFALHHAILNIESHQKPKFMVQSVKSNSVMEFKATASTAHTSTMFLISF